MKSVILSLCMGIGFFGFQTATYARIIESSPVKQELWELYSSEGCSSCPEADRWFSSHKDNPDLWTRFVPVVFHVTYWDYLGWKDLFARKSYTRRQRNYARLWHAPSIYTPGVVRDGSEWRQWRSGTPRRWPKDQNTGVLKIEWNDERPIFGQNVSFDYRPIQDVESSWDLHVALLGFGMLSDVLRGENRGRRLEHNFVVLELKSHELASRNGVFQTQMKFETPAVDLKAQLGIAAWIERRGDIRPVQSVGGYL